MSGKLEGIRVRFLLWIHNLGLVCLWIINVLMHVCAESRVWVGGWGEELHQDTDVMVEGKQFWKATGQVGHLMSTSSSSMPCHCERPH